MRFFVTIFSILVISLVGKAEVGDKSRDPIAKAIQNIDDSQNVFESCSVVRRGFDGSTIETAPFKLVSINSSESKVYDAELVLSKFRFRITHSRGQLGEVEPLPLITTTRESRNGTMSPQAYFTFQSVEYSSPLRFISVFQITTETRHLRPEIQYTNGEIGIFESIRDPRSGNLKLKHHFNFCGQKEETEWYENSIATHNHYIEVNCRTKSMMMISCMTMF